MSARHTFVGHEGQDTHILDGTIHPNEVGYAVIFQDMVHTGEAPEPGTLALLGVEGLSLAGSTWRRRHPAVT
jgi:hypothetical protein